MLIASWERDQRRTRANISVTVTTKCYLHRYPTPAFARNISEGRTGQAYTNRGCHICHSCFQKQHVERREAHVPFIKCNSKPEVNDSISRPHSPAVLFLQSTASAYIMRSLIKIHRGKKPKNYSTKTVHISNTRGRKKGLFEVVPLSEEFKKNFNIILCELSGIHVYLGFKRVYMEILNT